MEQDAALHVIENFWDDYSNQFDANHDTEDEQAWEAALAELIGEQRTQNVLDLGSGTGFLSNITARLGYPSVGVDIATGMLAHAVRNADACGSSALYMEGNALDLPSCDGTVDNIVNARLLWTIIKPDAMAREWFRVLRPGGKLLCFNRMEEGVGMQTSRTRPIYDTDGMDDELVYQNASFEELVDLLERNGFEDVEIRKLPGLTRPGYSWQCWHVLMGRKPEDIELRNTLRVAAFLDRLAPDYQEQNRLTDESQWFDTLSGLMRRDGTVLVAPGGSGAVANLLSSGGCESVVACGTSRIMTRLGKTESRKRGTNVSFQYGDLVSLPYDAESFETIVVGALLWSVLDDTRALSELYRVLKPEGVIVALRSPEGETDAARCKEEAALDALPFAGIGDDELAKLLSDHGFIDAHRQTLRGCRTANAPLDDWQACVATK